MTRNDRVSVGQINRLIRKSDRRSRLPEEGCSTRMRFFTPDRCYYDAQPAPAAIFPAYMAYLRALKDALPDAFIEMATHLDLHDAELLNIDFDRKSGRLRLLLKTWPVGESRSRRVRLDYSDAAILPDTRVFFRKLMRRKRKGTIIAHEGDVSVEGQCEHRLLCCPHGELVIECRDCRHAWVR